MIDHPHAHTLRKVYDAFTVGDVQTAASYWTTDCVHHYPGRSQLAGTHKGIEDSLAFAGKLFELTQGQMRMDILEIGASDNHAFALVHTRYGYQGKTIEMPFVNITRFQDGKIAEFWTYPDDQYAIDEFWG